MARLGAVAIGAAAMGLCAGVAGAQQKQVVTGPVAEYWVSAQTLSGFGAGMSGGQPSMGAMMGMMMGGGSSAQHLLTLQLGSSQKPAGEPIADHLPPQGLKAGPDLPLVTPRQAPVQRTEEEPGLPREYQKPKGRMLIFWGCGERARPGQPLVIDFSQVAAGKVPPGLEALGRGLSVTPMRPPSPSRNATYGEWPNAKARTQVPPTGSLVGEHVVKGTYSPEIRFSLTPAQDFLAPLNLTTNRIAPSGAGQLGWGLVPGAQAYLASAMGADGKDTMVLWTSSEVQAAAFALPDYLSQADISRLVGSKALMGPQTAACAVPAEVVKAAPQAMVQLVAYGGEANFAYPPRPADPKVAWNIAWTTKVRYRAQTGALLGMAMPGYGGPSANEEEEEGDAPAQPGGPPPKKRPGLPLPPGVGDSILKGLGGRIPGT